MVKKTKQGLEKPKKVMKHAKPKASPKKAALEKAGHHKNKLNKVNLEKLGKMTLDDKIQAAAKTEGTERL